MFRASFTSVLVINVKITFCKSFIFKAYSSWPMIVLHILQFLSKHDLEIPNALCGRGAILPIFPFHHQPLCNITEIAKSYPCLPQAPLSGFCCHKMKLINQSKNYIYLPHTFIFVINTLNLEYLS